MWIHYNNELYESLDTYMMQYTGILWWKLADLMCHPFGIMLSRKSIDLVSYKSFPNVII